MQNSCEHAVELMKEKEGGGGVRVKVYMRETGSVCLCRGSYFERDRENVTMVGGRGGLCVC